MKEYREKCMLLKKQKYWRYNRRVIFEYRTHRGEENEHKRHFCDLEEETGCLLFRLAFENNIQEQSRIILLTVACPDEVNGKPWRT